MRPPRASLTTAPAYAYHAGYNVSDSVITSTGDRSVGVVTVAPTLLSSATVLQTQTVATAYNGSTIRSAVGDDTGPATTAVYTAGSYGSGQQLTAGWRNFSTNTQLFNGNANTRTVELLGGKLFGSMGSGSTVGIYVIDSSGSNPAFGATSWISVGTSSNHSPYEFALFDDKTNANTSNGYNVAYIADDGNAGAAAGGIEKWTWNGTAWGQAYILQSSTGVYYHGLAGQLDAATGNAVLFATTSDGTKLQQITDPLTATTASSDTYLTLATASTDYWFRGVALDPIPAAPTQNPGDVNGDKKVDINDLTIVLTNYGKTGQAWSQGCMDGDSTGTVDINDLTIVLTDYGKTYSAAAGLKAVPEPASLVLLGMGAIALLAFGWRRRVS